MAPNTIRNLGRVGLGLAICLSLTACPKNDAPPAPDSHHTPTNEQSYLEHTISYSGETLAEIAAWYTGRGSNWTAIRDANPNIRPDRLRLGQVILIPKNLITNEKPFSRKTVKKTTKTEQTPEVMPTPTVSEPGSGGETTVTPTSSPELTPTDAPALTPTDASVVPVATKEPTAAPTPAPTLAPEAVTPKPTSKDLEREKLLDELLK